MSAFLVIAREGVEFSILLLLLASVYRKYIKQILISAAVVIFAGVIAARLGFPLSGFAKNAYIAFSFYSFLMLLLMSLVSGKAVVYPIVSIVLMFFIPSVEISSVTLEEALLKGGTVILPGFAGAAAAGLVFAVGLKALSKYDLERFFGADGIYVFLAAFCFVFGGLNEFDHSSVITSLQRGLYVFFSFFIPFMKNILLVPDGGMISTAFDDIGDYLSSQRVAMAVTAIILFLPPLFVFIRLLLTPEPVTDGVEKRATRRKALSIYRDELLRKGTPLLFSLLVSIVMLHAANLAARPTYEPEPVPVAAEGDVITIPLKDRFGDFSDGKIRKYSFMHQGATYRFMAVMRPDGEVAAVLDACEICPPRGYVQRGGHVICKYCNTPIPLQSIGRPGGCNPIPLKYGVEKDNLILSMSDIVSAFKKEAGKESGAAQR